MLPIKLEGIDESIYAGFWRRFGAFWLDSLIMAPWAILVTYINNAGRLNILYTIIPSYLFYFFYSIYCVKRWGGTPGKLICKIKIINISGHSVGWREAILRHSIDLLIGIPMMVAIVMVMFGMTDDQYNSMGFMVRSQWIMDKTPIWSKPASWIQQIWIWSEFIVLLCNKRRRAIHDFVAGTVVIKKKFEKEAEQAHAADI